MLMFDMDFTEVGNPCILGMIENDMESRVDDMLAFIYENGLDANITAKQLECLFSEYGIVYDLLPNYVRDRIDNVELVWSD